MGSSGEPPKLPSGHWAMDNAQELHARLSNLNLVSEHEAVTYFNVYFQLHFLI